MILKSILGSGSRSLSFCAELTSAKNKAQFGDLGGFVHDVDAVEVVHDDPLADVVVDARGGSA